METDIVSFQVFVLLYKYSFPILMFSASKIEKNL